MKLSKTHGVIMLLFVLLVLGIWSMLPRPTKESAENIANGATGAASGFFAVIAVLVGLILLGVLAVAVARRITAMRENNVYEGGATIAKTSPSHTLFSILAWIALMVITHTLLPEVWNWWYGKTQLFLATQFVFVILLFVFYGKKQFTWMLVAGIAVVFYLGLQSMLIEEGIVTPEDSTGNNFEHADCLDQGRAVTCTGMAISTMFTPLNPMNVMPGHVTTQWCYSSGTMRIIYRYQKTQGGLTRWADAHEDYRCGPDIIENQIGATTKRGIPWSKVRDLRIQFKAESGEMPYKVFIHPSS